MPPGNIPGSPQDWLSRAQGKLALAQVPLPSGGYLEDLCFWAQQAAELAVKAVYQQYAWAFPYTQNLTVLLDGLEQQGMTLPPEVRAAETLTDFATLTRYPGLAPPVTDAEYQDALRIAEAVLGWAESLIP